MVMVVIMIGLVPAGAVFRAGEFETVDELVLGLGDSIALRRDHHGRANADKQETQKSHRLYLPFLKPIFGIA